MFNFKVAKESETVFCELKDKDGTALVVTFTADELKDIESVQSGVSATHAVLFFPWLWAFVQTHWQSDPKLVTRYLESVAYRALGVNIGNDAVQGFIAMVRTFETPKTAMQALQAFMFASHKSGCKIARAPFAALRLWYSPKSDTVWPNGVAKPIAQRVRKPRANKGPKAPKLTGKDKPVKGTGEAIPDYLVNAACKVNKYLQNFLSDPSIEGYTIPEIETSEWLEGAFLPAVKGLLEAYTEDHYNTFLNSKGARKVS